MMSSLRVLMPSNSKTGPKNGSSMANTGGKELILRRPGVPVTSIQTDWMCKRISHFKVSREVALVGIGLYCYWGQTGDTINAEISIVEFKTGKVVHKAMAALTPTKGAPAVQRVIFKEPVQLKPDRLYEAMAYYDQFVPLYLKTDPFQSVQSVTSDGLTVAFKQMLPKGRYQADCYPSEIPELIFH